MNKYIKKGFCLTLAVLLIASTFAGCKKINYVTDGAIQAIHEIKDGSWQKQDTDETEDQGDVSVLDKSFEAGTYGGVEFKSLEDVANYYKEAYDYTKSLTAQYEEDGKAVTYYKLLGEEKLNVGEVIIGGSANKIINNLVPGIVDSMFAPNAYGLVPCYDKDPKKDNNSQDAARKADHDFRTSAITADDILDANIVDNGDGTITMTIQPKAAEMSTRGDDSQGRFFEVLGDISKVMADLTIVSFTEGDAYDNVKVTYKGGTVVAKIDTKTKEVLEADYHMVTSINITHVSVAVIKDKSASLIITYDNHFPASDEYLKEAKNIVRK